MSLSFTENGDLTHTTSGSVLVDADFRLVRGADATTIFTSLQEKRVPLADRLALLFYTRGVRKGKGERDLFYKGLATFIELPEFHTYARMKQLLALVPEYGSWRDLRALYQCLDCDIARSAIIEIFAEALKGREGRTSLVAKWAPREGSSTATMAKDLRKYMRLGPKEYRQLVSSLSRAIDVAEIKMCARQWAELKIATIPAKLMTKCRKAFLDEIAHACPKHRKPTRNGHPDCEYCQQATLRKDNRRHHEGDLEYADRNVCREHVLEACKEGKIKGANADVLDLIRPYLNQLSPTEDVVIETQYRDYLNKLRKSGKANGMLALSDVSGSMNGNPMLVSIFLGVVLADLNAGGPFGGRVLTFESDPQLFQLNPENSLHLKVQQLSLAPWGGCTNFDAAFRRLLQYARENSVSQEQFPRTLVVLSDMQFDQADGSANETAFQRLKADFERENLTLPHLVFWNLRDCGERVPVRSNVPGVTLMSGFSVKVLEFLLETGETMEVPVPPTPAEQLRTILNHEYFGKVRALAGPVSVREPIAASAESNGSRLLLNARLAAIRDGYISDSDTPVASWCQ